MRTLVTGATGFIGSAVVRRLLHAGHDVRALVRDEDKAAALRGQGVEVVRGDLDDPSSLTEAVAGVDKIYLVSFMQHGLGFFDDETCRLGSAENPFCR